MISAILQRNNGVVTITRPYDDMLLIRSPDTVLIMARCPQQDAQ